MFPREPVTDKRERANRLKQKSLLQVGLIRYLQGLMLLHMHKDPRKGDAASVGLPSHSDPFLSTYLIFQSSYGLPFKKGFRIVKFQELFFNPESFHSKGPEIGFRIFILIPYLRKLDQLVELILVSIFICKDYLVKLFRALLGRSLPSFSNARV